MKKFLALLLSLSMVLALSACGGTKSDDDNAKGDETKTDAPTLRSASSCSMMRTPPMT